MFSFVLSFFLFFFFCFFIVIIVVILLRLLTLAECRAIFVVAVNAGDSCGGWAESVASVEGSVRHHQRVFISAPAALPSDAQHHLCREELDHHLPAADGDPAALHQAGRRSDADARRPHAPDAVDTGRRRSRRSGRMSSKRQAQQRLHRVDTDRNKPLRSARSHSMTDWLTVISDHFTILPY